MLIYNKSLKLRIDINFNFFLQIWSDQHHDLERESKKKEQQDSVDSNQIFMEVDWLLLGEDLEV